MPLVARRPTSGEAQEQRPASARPDAAGDPRQATPPFGTIGRRLRPRPPLPLVAFEPLGTADHGPVAPDAPTRWGAIDETTATGPEERETAPDPSAGGAPAQDGAPDPTGPSDWPLVGPARARRLRGRPRDAEPGRSATPGPTFAPSYAGDATVYPVGRDEPTGSPAGAGEPAGVAWPLAPDRRPLAAPTAAPDLAAARPAGAGEPARDAPGADRPRPADLSIADLSPASVVFVPAARGAARPPIWAAPEAFPQPPAELLVAAAASESRASGAQPVLARADVGRDTAVAVTAPGTLSTAEAPPESAPPSDPHRLAEQVYALLKRRLALESERAGLLSNRRRW
jgi:hypothetical protein